MWNYKGTDICNFASYEVKAIPKNWVFLTQWINMYENLQVIALVDLQVNSLVILHVNAIVNLPVKALVMFQVSSQVNAR